ncbi:probable serine/threonine-protein kinase mkcB [Anastrepha ludens]|uniref:probable serine/threonine-protein kinase mkcB n=1 Tax=Anastrepha ludens TaxID=28586 RepID=UPI0023B0F82C|nr:probable serine/threonine-protein kinase mkcB [Anastrepha ludens]
MNGSADGDCAATPAPPVAARRATLTPHYAATTSTSVTAPRATPPDIERSGTNAFKAHSDNSAITANVQVVLLQNQVDTLQWQLKQVETGKEMYRAVIEEVARFLDRYQTQRQQQHQVQQQQQISRSKSLYQVYDGSSNGQDTEQNASGDKSATTTSCLRARSTTNPNVDQKQSANNSSKTSRAKMEHDAINPSPNNPYTTFKDFTWRRSPRKYAESKALAAANEVEEKLNQEAFRLSRTIQNLLNTSTQQPDLTQHRNALIARSNGAQSKVTKTPLLPPPTNPAPPTIIPKLIMPAQSNANKKHIANVEADKCNSLAVPADSSLATATAEMLFLRANVIRDSRLSLRSSTDSSVHSTTSNSSAVSSSSSSAASTTSSKVETDEDISPHHPFHPIALPNKQHQHPLSSATEDESGFSSISSFHDVGVPLSSTMISNRMSLPNVKFGTANCAKVTVTASDVSDNNETSNSRNSTLKANHPSNVLGLPLQAAHDMQHRWDTTTKTSYRNANTYQRFSTLSNEDAAAVLWV